MKIFGLKKELINSFNNIFIKYPEIDEVVIYGSRAKGNFREGSDIDISLKGANVSEEIRSSVWLDLDDLNSPYLIDLSIFNKISSDSLKEHIERAGKILYKKGETITSVHE